MITVHHLNNSRSQRVLWLLEELGVPYELKRYERDARTMLAPLALRQVHPLGKSPVISDEGRVVAESGAIIEYLVERYDSGRLAPPPASEARLRYRYWLHYAEGSAMFPLLLALVFRRLPKQRMPFFARPIVRALAMQVERRYIEPQLQLHFDFMQQALEQSVWFAGDAFSAADIQMSFPLEAMDAGGDLDRWPRLAEFLRRVRERPAYQRALQRGGPFELGH